MCNLFRRSEMMNFRRRLVAVIPQSRSRMIERYVRYLNLEGQCKAIQDNKSSVYND